MTRPRNRILVVDDDPDIRELLSDRLQLMQLEVTCAADGQEALALLRQDAPPLTLLDLQLPRLNGMEVLQAIRREGLETTVIVITASGSVERAVEAMRAGAYDFLPKPLDPAYLEVVITKALERDSLREENRLLHGELENAIQRAVVLSTGPEIGPRDLPILRGESDEDTPTEASGTYHEAVLQLKRELLRSALDRAQGNQTRAAEALGLQRAYLSRLLQDLGIRNPEERTP